jgi:hypothetical protein
MKNMKQFITIISMAAAIAHAHGQGGLAPARTPLAAEPLEPPSDVTVGPRGIVTSRGVYAQNANAASDFGGAYGYVSRSSGSSVPPVVIQFGTKTSDAIAGMEEDLAVMTLIIDRALERLGQDVPDEKMGIKLYYTSGGKSVRALYLENFGPLFMVKVNFPVHAPTEVESKEPEKPDDSEWNEARRRVLGEPENARWTASSSGVPYEAERVEELKKQLIAALRNASNMKGVKADEYVTVTVFGAPAVAVGGEWRKWSGKSDSSPQPRAGGGRGVAQTSANRAVTAVVEMNADNARNSLQGTVLTLRIKKSDIDAAGNDAEALGKKAAVTTYAGNGHGLSSVNSWIRGSSSSSLQVR